MPYKDAEKRREAQRKYQQKYYQQNTQYYKDKAKEKKQLIKQLVRDAKSVPCSDCNIQYPYYVMQFDHVSGEKISNVAEMYNSGSLSKVRAEIDKCEVVCSNCHAERTFKRSGVEQSGSSTVS